MASNRPFRITDARGGAAISVRVVTQAEKTAITGKQDGVLRVRLMASPAGDPAANKELVEFLAARLSVPLDHVEVVAGAGGRDKIVTVDSLTAGEVDQLLVADETSDES